MAFLQTELGDIDEAIKTYKEIIQKYPKYRPARDSLVHLYSMNYNESNNYLDKAASGQRPER